MQNGLQGRKIRRILGYMHEQLAVVLQHHPGGAGGLLPYLVVFVIGAIVGRLWGRRAGLKHLGEAEFRTRWTNVQRLRRW
jgi:hypothetical protein